MAVPVLGDAQVGDRAQVGVELGEVAAARLAVEHGDNLHGGLLGGDVRVARAAVADDADILFKVDGVHLGQLAHACDGLEDGHSHSHFNIPLHSAGNPLLDEHGKSGDEHTVQHARLALGEAVVVGGDKGNLFLLHPPLKGCYIPGHLPDLLHRAAALNLESVQDILGLGPDGILVGDIVGDGPQLLPVELLGIQEHPMVEVGLVDVQIHHAGVGPANLGQVGIPEAAAHLGGSAPVLNLRLDPGVSSFGNPSDDSVALARPLQVSHHLTHRAAGVQLAQPGCGISILIIGSQLLLEVDQHYRHVQVPDGRKHVVGGGVGQQLEYDQVHIGGPEFVPRRLGQLLGGDQTAVNELHGVGEQLFKGLVLGLKLGHQSGELGQVGPQGDGKYADPRFCVH